MTSDKPVDNKTRTTSTSLAETLIGGNLCCFYYLAVVSQNSQYRDKPFFLRISQARWPNLPAHAMRHVEICIEPDRATRRIAVTFANVECGRLSR